MARFRTNRRSFFITALGMTSTLKLSSTWAQASRNVFTLGVGSGSPRADGVTLWTRLAPDPLQGGGLPDEDAMVRVRICTDPEMRNTVIDETTTAPAADGHSVHYTARGLLPHFEYFYQFYFGEEASPTGRTRTAPVNDTPIHFTLASCQHLEYGYYGAYADMVQQNPDFVVHVGDYIYEYEPGPLGQVERVIMGETIAVNRVRQHASAETRTLWDYRNRYAQYKLDPDLQAAHAAAPWIVSFDDHEVDNDWAGYTPEDPHRQTAQEFRLRRWAGLKAFYEHMPLERRPTYDLEKLHSHLPIVDRFDFGPQLSLLQMDTRQYRTDQPCADDMPAAVDCPGRYANRASMTGDAQEHYIREELRRSNARWNLLAQQTWMSQIRYPGERYNMDQWDGYPAQRARLVEELNRPQLNNPVVLSGDWHSGAAMNVMTDYDPNSTGKDSANIAAAELAGTSVTTPCPWTPAVNAALPENPHVKYYGGNQRGYLNCHLDNSTLRAEYRVTDHPDQRDAGLRIDQSVVVVNGKRGVSLA